MVRIERELCKYLKNYFFLVASITSLPSGAAPQIISFTLLRSYFSTMSLFKRNCINGGTANNTGILYFSMHFKYVSGSNLSTIIIFLFRHTYDIVDIKPYMWKSGKI